VFRPTSRAAHHYTSPTEVGEHALSAKAPTANSRNYEHREGRHPPATAAAVEANNDDTNTTPKSSTHHHGNATTHTKPSRKQPEQERAGFMEARLGNATIPAGSAGLTCPVPVKASTAPIVLSTITTSVSCARDKNPAAHREKGTVDERQQCPDPCSRFYCCAPASHLIPVAADTLRSISARVLSRGQPHG